MAEKRKKTYPSIQDVAKEAGVSVATASRVLSNSSYPVTQALKKKVIKAAKDLNYTPNLLGKMLKSNSVMAIGVIVPTLQNPFFNQVILGIEAAARNSDYEVIIFSSHRSIEQERKNIMTLLQNRVMALIIMSIDDKPDALQNYMDCGGTVALLESDFKLSRGVKAEINYFEAGELAASHLIDTGHRNIAFLTSPLTKNYRRQILDGVKHCFEKNKIDFSEKDVFVANAEEESDTGLYEFELGRKLVKDFMKQRKKYSAIIAINDITAFGIIQALTQNGIKVPEDVSVISFDNITYSEMISPPLTTVELHSSAMGSTACKLLISSVLSSAESGPDVSFNYHCRLEERQSIKTLNHDKK